MDHAEKWLPSRRPGHRPRLAIRRLDSPCFRHAGLPLTQPTSNTAAPPPGRAEPPTWRIASLGLASTLLATAISYLFQIVVARLMPTQSYSEMLAMLSLYMICTLPMTPVFLLVTRRVVEARLREADADIRVLLLTLARGIALASLVLVALGFVFREQAAGWLSISDPRAAPIFATSVAVSALYLLVVSVLLGREAWLMANALPVLLGLGRIVLSLVFVRPGFEVGGAFLAITGSAVLCLAAGASVALRGLPRGGVYRALHVTEVGLAVTVNLAFWFLVQVDTIYVNKQLPDVALQGYAAASALGRMLVYIPVAVGNVLFPLLIAARTPAAGRTMLLRMLLLTVALDAIGFGIIAVSPERLLLLTLGGQYLTATSLLLPVAAVLAPFAVAAVFMYEALARHDRFITAVFAAAAILTAVTLVTVQPALHTLFAVLLTGAAIAITGGALRTAIARRDRQAIVPESVP
jgi:O-antigen/teichoic acid export membrane protein